MPALAAGKLAPQIDLPGINGRHFSLRDALQRGPVLLAFFKVTCPVCQYALPFVERIHRAHKGKAQVIAISQHPSKETQQFMREFGITMPVLLENPDSYQVSNAYGLTNVPSLFLVAPGGEIEVSSVGWNKEDLQDINRRIAQSLSLSVPQLFHRGESVIDYKAG